MTQTDYYIILVAVICLTGFIEISNKLSKIIKLLDAKGLKSFMIVKIRTKEKVQ